MTPRLDPALPVVWRSPDTVQVGAASPRAVIERPGALETGLLQALRHGAGLATLITIGSGLDGSPEQVREFVARLAPACVTPEGPSDATTRLPDPAGRLVVAVDGEGPLAELIAAHLLALGYDAGPLDACQGDPALVVIVAGWAIPPGRHLPWMRRDIPHLVVLADDAGVRVGPLVEPGSGPCIRCLDLARRDADAAWPVIAAQLAGRPVPEDPARVRFDAASAAAAAVDDHLRQGGSSLTAASISFARSPSAVQHRRHEEHPQCGCRAPGGIAIPHALTDAGRRPGPSSTTTAAVPA